MIAIDFSKQKALDTDPKSTQEINFTANLDQEGKNHFRFFTRNFESIVILFCCNMISI